MAEKSGFYTLAEINNMLDVPTYDLNKLRSKLSINSYKDINSGRVITPAEYESLNRINKTKWTEYKDIGIGIISEARKFDSSFGKLNTLVKNGEISLKDYYQASRDLKSKFDSFNSSVNYDKKNNYRDHYSFPQYVASEFINSNFVRRENGEMAPKLPFSAAEYLRLPNDMLPKREDVTSGLIPAEAIPLNRFYIDPTSTQQTPPQNQVIPPPNQPVAPPVAPPVTPQITPPITQPTSTPGADPTDPNLLNTLTPPQPFYNSNITPPVTVPETPPPPVTPTMDQQQLSAEAERERNDQLAALNLYLSQMQGALNNQTNQLSAIPTQLTESLSGAMSKRKQTFDEYAKLLRQQEDTQMQQMTPVMLEDLNSRGLMTSSALGEALARERSNLAANSSNTLSQMGLDTSNYEASQLMDIANQKSALQQALAQQGYDLTGNYATGVLGTTQYASDMNRAGIQRRFSLEDWQREADLARQLGAQVTPQVDSSGGAGLGGILAGGATGAGTGFMIGGPTGAAIGAGAGSLLGLIGGKGGGK